MYSGAEYSASGYYRLPLTSSSLAVLAFKSTSVIRIRDASTDPRVNQQVVTDTGIRSSIAAPLLIGDDPVGVLISGTTRVIRDYTERDVRVINALAQEAALIVNTLLLHEDYRQSEQRYRQLNELAPDPVLLLDGEGKIIEANRAAQQLFQLGMTELIGRDMESFVAEGTDRRTCRQALLLDRSETPKICEFALAQTRDGMPVVIQVHAMALKLGNTQVIQAILRDVTDHKQAAERIRRSEEELSSIFNSMQDTFYRTDIEGRVVRVTPSVETLFGYTPDEVIGRQLANLYASPSDRALFLKTLQDSGGVLKGYEAQMRRKDGTVFWVSTNAQYYRDHDGKIAGVEGSARDITRMRRAQEELYQEKERAQVTLESIGDGVITTDVDGYIEYLNPVAEQLCGWSAGEAVGSRFEEIFRLVDETNRYTIDSPIEACLSRHVPLSSDRDVVLIDKHGREFAIEYSVAPLRDRDHETVGTVVGLHDVTEMRQMALQLTHQASHDALTGLINRREFEVRLRNALDIAHTEKEQHALCYLDLDQFKIVNDTCGHVAGDELLKQIGARLREKVRRADTLARLGGDEFGVLLWDCPLDTAQKITEDLRQAVQENRFSWQGHIFDIGVSIGLVPINAESGTLTEVLSAADSACYAAKDRGRNRVHVYQPDDQVLAQRHGEMQWVSRINQSMEQGRLRLYGQRIVAVANDGPVLRWEVLVRMLREDGEIIPPMAFIPAAERYHLMPRIDEWVIQEALKILARYRASDVVFNINVSGQSLSDDGFLDRMLAALDDHAADASQICFEITETAAIANLTQANRFIGSLRTRGCQFALDDFGSGLSSFGYLKNLSVDYLKIDGSFVRDIVDDPIDYAMVESINNVGHTLGLETIAEFVEKEAVLQKVRELGVDYVQGYLMSVPVPLEADVAAQVGAKMSDTGH
jgi:diguanylate cyclase (GGDEF)-like protein/PAS domain S-box-containing protein